MLSSCLKTEHLSEPKVLSVKHPYRAAGTYVFKMKNLAAECKPSTKLKHAVYASVQSFYSFSNIPSEIKGDF